MNLETVASEIPEPLTYRRGCTFNWPHLLELVKLRMSKAVVECFICYAPRHGIVATLCGQQRVLSNGVFHVFNPNLVSILILFSFANLIIK